MSLSFVPITDVFISEYECFCQETHQPGPIKYKLEPAQEEENA